MIRTGHIAVTPWRSAAMRIVNMLAKEAVLGSICMVDALLYLAFLAH